jgi:MFS family permease
VALTEDTPETEDAPHAGAAARMGTWAPLRVRNYRLFFAGQLVSVPGTWLQTIAQSWLVLQLTGSGSALGLTVALQSLPVLVGGAWGGLVVDRVDKRRALIATQVAQAALALALGLLVVTGTVELWMVWVLAFGLGVTRTIDSPARQSFVSEMVGSRLLPSAIALNSVVVSAARAVGPATGGVLIAAFGVGVCFLINAASFAAVIFGLLAMRTADLRPAERTPRGAHQVRDGVAYVRGLPALRVPLAMMVLVGTFAYEFQVSIPLLAQTTFHAGAAGFGLLYAAMGAGSVAGGLLIAGRVAPDIRTLAAAAGCFGILLGGVAVSPDVVVAGALLALAGAASVVLSSATNSTLQIHADPMLRGRVMALYVVAFLGTTPIGGPIVGWVGEAAGPRWAIAIGAVACGLAALMAVRVLRRPEAVAAAGVAGD